MLTGDFNGDGILDGFSSDLNLGANAEAAEDLALRLFGNSNNATAINLRELRVKFGDGASDPFDTPIEDWDVAGVVGEFSTEVYDTDLAFGNYPIAEQVTLEFINEDLSAYVSVVLGEYGADGIEVYYSFYGSASSYFEIYETYEGDYSGGYEDYYVFEPYFETDDADVVEYYWFDGSGWVLGDASGIAPVYEFGAVLGTEGDDILDGTAVSQEIFGFGGDDIIDARGSDDTIFGGDGDDSIYGNGGDDVMFGGDGDDTFEAGDGNDEFYGGDGFDFVDFSSFNPQRGVKISLGSDKGEDIYGKNPKNFELVLESIESIKGSRGDDRIQGKDGVEHTLDGHDGDDRLFGADLSDILIDGAGSDNMHGRGGADTFVLVADNERDTISDFEIGLDKIDLFQWGVEGIADLEIRYHATQVDRVLVVYEDEALLVKADVSESALTDADFIFI